MSAHFQSAHFGTTHFESAHFGREQIITPPPDFTPDDVPHPPGTSRISPDVRRMLEEEELIMLVIRAFLMLKDRE